jgi:hypothetical protein
LLDRANPHGYYAAVAAFLAALIPAERALLCVPPPLSRARPSVGDLQEVCDGCPISA